MSCGPFGCTDDTVKDNSGACNGCGHSLENNMHGFDQNDGWLDGDRLVHSGRCTYCKICNPAIFKVEVLR